MRRDQSHGSSTNSLSHNHLRRSDVDMDIRDSFTKLKKKVKKVGHLGSRRKPDRTGPDDDGEGIDLADPLPRPGTHVVTGDREGSESEAGGRQASSTEQPPQPDELVPVPASGSNYEQGEAVVDGNKASLMCLHPHQGVGIGAGSGPSQERDGAEGEEDEEFYSCSSNPSTPHSGEPDGK